MQRTLYDAKCATCNQPTTVPFKPTPGKPVYCKTCFAKRLANPSQKAQATSCFEPKQVWARRR
ncbi:MAG: hypothetical protein NWE92_10725 [Candidatus Bathyarchaeota archaeon]|nr:hypothetical protein [Candidatus Bathyarchaeota archaeon]